MMENLFDPKRSYTLDDPELTLIGTREKLSQWRYRNFGPAYFKLGKKVIYRGVDLNAFAEAHRVTPDAA